MVCAAVFTTVMTACQHAKESEYKPEKKEETGVIEVNTEAERIEGKSYQTVTEALEYVNANPPASESERITIQIQEGIYREQLTLTAPYITLQGTGDAEDTVLTYYYGASNIYKSVNEDISIGNSASTIIKQSAHDFIGENITFENSHNIYVPEEEKADYSEENKTDIELRCEEPWNDDYETQAVALEVEADRSAFRNCKIISRQDTLFVNCQARCYFYECFIEGTADFICGDATSVFEKCTLNCPYDAGYVTASACSKNNPYGYLFKDCTISCNPPKGLERPQDGDYSLGRPWNNLPQVIFWNCKMDSHIAEVEYRFIGMKKEYKPRDCRFIEFGTMDIDGKLQNLEEIVAPYEILLTEEELEEKYSVEKHLQAKFDDASQSLLEADNWIPFS